MCFVNVYLCMYYPIFTCTCTLRHLCLLTITTVTDTTDAEMDLLDDGENVCPSALSENIVPHEEDEEDDEDFCFASAEVCVSYILLIILFNRRHVNLPNLCLNRLLMLLNYG